MNRWEIEPIHPGVPRLSISPAQLESAGWSFEPVALNRQISGRYIVHSSTAEHPAMVGMELLPPLVAVMSLFAAHRRIRLYCEPNARPGWFGMRKNPKVSKKITISSALWLAALLAANPVLGGAELRSESRAVNLDAIEWGSPTSGGGAPDGTRTARQGVDPATGGVTYYAMFPAGGHFDLHWHTHDEYVVVARGSVTLELGDEIHHLRTGAYVVIPGGVNHSWDVPESGDVIILVRRAGPADFNFVE